MTSKTFNVTFHSMDVMPSKPCEVVLYNQCDGYHQVQAHFWDGKFQGFYTFTGDSPLPPEYFAAWAELPDCNEDLYPVFGDSRPFGERT